MIERQCKQTPIKVSRLSFSAVSLPRCSVLTLAKLWHHLQPACSTKVETHPAAALRGRCRRTLAGLKLVIPLWGLPS